MKIFICLALFAMIAVAIAADKKDEKEKTKVIPEGAKAATRDGRFYYVKDLGLYDTHYKSYVVVGTPAYSDYSRSYYSYYPSSSHYYLSY